MKIIQIVAIAGMSPRSIAAAQRSAATPDGWVATWATPTTFDRPVLPPNANMPVEGEKLGHPVHH